MKKSTPTKMTPARITAFLDSLKAAENAQKFALEQLLIKIQQWDQTIKTIQEQLTTKISELPSLKKEIEPKLKEIDSAITAYQNKLNSLSNDTIPEFDKKLEIIVATDSKNTNITEIQGCITNIKAHVANQHTRLTEITTPFAVVKERYETPLHVEKLCSSTEIVAASVVFLQNLKDPQALPAEQRAKMCLLSGKLTNAQQSLAALTAQNADPVTPTTPATPATPAKLASSEHKGAPHVQNK